MGRRKKRTRFQVPGYKPRPIKALWESASDADRERAHRTAMVMLEYWTAQISKLEAAERLGLAPLRVWQLSQQAVSGMLAGLLTQPRDRGSSKGVEARDGRGERRSQRERALEKRVARLEEKLAASARLVEVMRELPVVRASGVEGLGKPASKRKAGGASKRRSTKGGRDKQTTKGKRALDDTSQRGGSDGASSSGGGARGTGRAGGGG